MQHMFTKITPGHDDWWQPSSSHQEVRVWQAWGRRLLREASFGWRWKRRTFGQYQGLPWTKVCWYIIMKDQNHLLLPSTMFSSVLRTLSKSCLRESLRSSMAGKIKERKMTTWIESLCLQQGGEEHKKFKEWRNGEKEQERTTCSLVAGGLRVRRAR